MRADRTIEISAAMCSSHLALPVFCMGYKGQYRGYAPVSTYQSRNPAEGYRIIAFLYSTNALLCLPCDDHIIYGKTHEYGDDH